MPASPIAMQSHSYRVAEPARLPLPEATMFIVATSGALWALIFGAFRWFMG